MQGRCRVDAGGARRVLHPSPTVPTSRATIIVRGGIGHASQPDSAHLGSVEGRCQRACDWHLMSKDKRFSFHKDKRFPFHKCQLCCTHAPWGCPWQPPLHPPPVPLQWGCTMGGYTSTRPIDNQIRHPWCHGGAQRGRGVGGVLRGFGRRANVFVEPLRVLCRPRHTQQ